MGTILALIQAIVELVKLIQGAVATYQQAKREGWLEDGKQLTKAIQDAKTDDERRALLKRLVEHAKA